MYGMIPGVWEERESEGGDLVPSPDAGVPEWAGGAARGSCFVSALRGFRERRRLFIFSSTGMPYIQVSL